jgi:hypothetical protein
MTRGFQILADVLFATCEVCFSAGDFPGDLDIWRENTGNSAFRDT